jgi:FkbM family methyltransferase
MNFKGLCESILTREEIRNEPPVLIDIGASEGLNPMWRSIAKYCIGIAFDADSRDFGYIENANSEFKALYIINKIVNDKAETPQQKFYLTQSPYCSSLLEPDEASLSKYYFADIFKVQKTIELEVIELPKALADLNLDRIDWFKSDCQGIDLRLFRSLPQKVRDNIIIAEFEPGIIDAYKGEDKMSDTLAFMENQDFFMTRFQVKGPVQVTPKTFKKVFPSDFQQKIAKNAAKTVPGWAELTYFNELKNTSVKSVRSYLLAWLFASLQENHDVALSFAENGFAAFQDSQFLEMRQYSAKMLRRQTFSISSIWKLALKYFKK